MGILSHSSNKAALNWSRVGGEGGGGGGAFWCPLTPLSISPHRCSIGDKSGLYRGQSSGLMLWLARKSWQTLAAWGRALSCWKIRWCCCTNGTATGWRISSLYLTPVKLPVITINGDFNPWDIPPQTITEPPPNLSLSRTQASAKCSPRRWPSGRKRVNRDSSVKKTRLHCLIGNCLGPCAANQAIWRAWRARVSIHVIELLCYNWRFANFWLEIWSHNWRFLSTYLMHVFIVYWCFPFVCFSIEPTASHFNMYCLHFCLK